MQSERPSAYLARLRLENIRAFRKIEISFRSTDGGPRMATVCLGANGTGKTTLLRTVAIGLAPESVAAGLLIQPTGSLVAQGADQGVIGIELCDRAGESLGTVVTTLTVEPSGHERVAAREGEDVLRSLAPFVCGYGVARYGEGAATSRRKDSIADSTHTLFSSGQALVGAELTLRRMRSSLGDAEYERALKGLKGALGLRPRDAIRVDDEGGVTVSGPSVGAEIPLEGWADGFRQTFHWILDIYSWAVRRGALAADGSPTGIVLLDEMEQHLHPSLQVTLLRRITQFFPHLQWIGTTHSPLITLGAADDAVLALHRTGSGKSAHVAIRPAPANLDSMSADEVLEASELFDVDPHNPEVAKQLADYRKLASKPTSKRTRVERERMGKIAQQVLEKPPSGKRNKAVLAKLDAIMRQIKG